MMSVSSEEVLKLTRVSLGLQVPSLSEELVDDEFISEMLRRLAGIYCPCSPATLKRVFLETLEDVVPVTEGLHEHLDVVLNALHAGGDLVELARVTTRDARTRDTWMFAASPSFVVLPSGTVRIFGLAPEETLPLPDFLRTRVMACGTARLLEPIDGEALRAPLLNAGFREQSIETWLRLPPPTSAGNYLRTMNSRLSAAAESGDIDGLRIFDPASGSGRYKDLWISPKRQTGRFTARRPHAHGADMWGYAELSGGRPLRFLDFPLPGSVHRGCDEAWNLQFALSSDTGSPHKYRLRPQGAGSAVDLVFPLPLWAERRLDVIGRRAERHQSLLSFWLPNSVLAEECAFLEESLWMKQASN